MKIEAGPGSRSLSAPREAECSFPSGHGGRRNTLLLGCRGRERGTSPRTVACGRYQFHAGMTEDRYSRWVRRSNGKKWTTLKAGK